MGNKGTRSSATVAHDNNNNSNGNNNNNNNNDNHDGSNGSAPPSKRHKCIQWCCYRSGKTGRKSMICCEWTTFLFYILSMTTVILIMFFFVPRPPCISFDQAYVQNIVLGPPSPVLPSSMAADVYLKLNVNNANYITIDLTGLYVDVYYSGNNTFPVCCTDVYTKVGTIIKTDRSTIKARTPSNALTLSALIYTQDANVMGGLYRDKQKNYITLILNGYADLELSGVPYTYTIDHVPTKVPLS